MQVQMQTFGMWRKLRISVIFQNINLQDFKQKSHFSWIKEIPSYSVFIYFF